ncbi:MAG: hypothetical protein FJ313_01475 [Gemmatimonadetes bacterium]|nr:hypothetical protein [Gemmatimonadota bacterium]
MPEAPDLQVVKEFLEARVLGLTVTAAAERRPLVMRNLAGAPFGPDATGRLIEAVARRGKTLLVNLSGGRLIVITPMLSGGLEYSPARQSARASTCVVLTLSDGFEVRYFDRNRTGKVYYLRSGQEGEVPGLSDQGPDVLDAPLTLEEFEERLRPFRGEIKGVLTRGKAVAGIGNAYADEILFEAGLFPFKRRARLSSDEMVRLHRAVYEVPARAFETLRKRVGDAIHREVRDFLRIHGRGDRPCPECGGPVTSITANRRLTNYCRRCQPGSLFQGP